MPKSWKCKDCKEAFEFYSDMRIHQEEQHGLAPLNKIWGGRDSEFKKTESGHYIHEPTKFIFNENQKKMFEKHAERTGKK